jgi:hypothetical protein
LTRRGALRLDLKFPMAFLPWRFGLLSFPDALAL